MKKIILLLIVLLSFSTVNAQEERIVTITSIGQGKTKEEAKEIAIKRAISLTHQTFISSKKEILNNKAVNDEIVLNTNGQIQKTDVVSEIQLPNNEYVTTLNVTMSVTKLTTFFESKGEIVEFKGGVFSQNIKLQKLKEDSENSIIKNLCLSSFEILKNSVDFAIKHSQPTVIGDEKNSYFGDDLSEYAENYAGNREFRSLLCGGFGRERCSDSAGNGDVYANWAGGYIADESAGKLVAGGANRGDSWRRKRRNRLCGFARWAGDSACVCNHLQRRKRR